MSNYGMNIGDGNTYNGNTNIKNKTTVKKGRTIVTISIVIVAVAVILLLSIFLNRKPSIIGRWVTDDGKHIEFLSDGTVHKNGYDSLYADTYEVMDEGYLKWGEYDSAWIQYRYTYWDISINGNHMTLTNRNNSNYTIELTKE